MEYVCGLRKTADSLPERRTVYCRKWRHHKPCHRLNLNLKPVYHFPDFDCKVTELFFYTIHALIFYIPGWSKKRNPGFNFGITSVNIHRLILIIFTVTTRNVWRIKVKLRLSRHRYSAKHTLLLISMLHFQMCNILRFTQTSLVVLIPYLLTYSQQCFMTTLLTSCCVYG